MRRLAKAVSVILCAMLVAASASHAQADASAPSEEVSALLTFVPDGFSLGVTLDLDRFSVRFAGGEPDYAGKDVMRGAIPLPDDAHPRYIGFAWDKTAGLLYVDANRDQNLTNDPGPYHATGIDAEIGIFDGVPVALEQDGLVIEYRLRLNLDSRWSSMEVTSGWEGVVTLGGQELSVRLTSGPGDSMVDSGLLLLRTMDASDESDASSQLYGPRGLPAFLVLSSGTYAVDTAFESTPEGTAVRVNFRTPSEPLGEVRVQGTHLREMHLGRGGGGRLIWLNGTTFRAPLGGYTVEQVRLEGGWEMNNYGPHVSSLNVEADQPAVLEVGGPLKNVLHAERSGSYLILSYAARDRNNLEYSPEGRYRNPPGFAIYRGDTRVAAGNFEYG